MLNKDKILEALKEVYDPEMMINIVDLGLIYDVDISGDDVNIQMTLTSPGCPIGDLLKSGVIATVKRMDGTAKVDVQFVWQPGWNPTFMSEEARITLGYDI